MGCYSFTVRDLHSLLLTGLRRRTVGSKHCALCKGGDFQCVQFPPGDESLQSVAVGAAEEVTNPSKPFMERIALGDSASMQAET